MKILFVRPPVPKQTLGLKNIMVCEPLGLEYAAAGISSKHEVKIFDFLVENGFDAVFENFAPEVIATNCYITGVNEVINLCRKIKNKNAACLTIVGGVHATRCPEDFADPSIDVIVLGDGTFKTAEIIEAFAQNQALVDIAGLAIPTGPDEVYKTSSIKAMQDPDKLPFPRRDLVAHLKDKYYYLFHQPLATVKTTWGCWYKCNFCFTWTITDGAVYSRSPRSIVDELETIEQEEIYIVDDIFLIKPNRLKELRDLIIARNIRKKFLVYGRSDFIAENEAIIKEWAEIGLSAVLIGLEASTDSELASMNKESSIDQNKRAIEVLTKYHVDTYGSFIPDPEYTEKDWDRLFEFIEDTGLYYLNISPLTPLPGTESFRKWEDDITIPRKAHSLWDLSHVVLPTKVPLKEYYRQLLKLYAKSCLDLRRTKSLPLRQRPPWYSKKYIRLYIGVLKSYWQLRKVYKDHSPKSLQEARALIPLNPKISFKVLQTNSELNKEIASITT